MSDEEADDLIARADQALGENRFAAAAELYRRAARARAPSGALAANLGVAEDMERLAWWREIAAIHAGSLLARLAYAKTLVDAGKPAQAIVEHTDLLQRFGADENAALTIRLARFQAATKKGPYATLIDDLVEIWTAGDAAPPARKLRRALVAGLARIDQPDAIPTLESLLERAALPSTGQALVTTKLAELRTLEAALDTIAGAPQEPVTK